MSELKISNLYVNVGKRELLKGINLEFKSGTFNALIGPNGAGKSTMLKAISNTNVSVKGSIKFLDKDLHSLNVLQMSKILSFMTQFSQVPNLNVFEVLSLGRRVFSQVRLSLEDHKIIEDMAKRLKIQDWLDIPIENLSGGERQKVFIASCLLQKPKILLLDEPISHLDPKNQHTMLEIIKKQTYDLKLITIIVLHDIHHALHYADNLIMLKNGNLIATKPNYEIKEEDIENLFDMPLEMYSIKGHKFIYFKHSHF